MPVSLRALALVCCLTPTSAFALLPGDYLDRTLLYRGVTRAYDLHVPTGHDGTTPIPLVIDLHGLGSFKETQQALSGLASLTDSAGFAIAWPNGVETSWNGGWCCGPAADNDPDDTGYLRTLAEQIALDLAVDRRRVYVTGLSNGGAMTQRLACEAADVFAAAAPLAFPIALLPIQTCQPVRSMPVLTFQGLTDVLVPYDGGGPFPSAAENFSYWRTANGCGDAEIEEQDTSGASDCKIDTSCADGVEVGLCSILSPEMIVGGHILYLNPDYALAELVWDFVSRFTLPAEPAPLPTPVAGKKLTLKDDADPSRRSLSLSLKDSAMVLDPALDPTQDGATLKLYGAGDTRDLACLSLPAAGWKRKGAGFVYKDKQGAAGPCKSAKLAPGKLEVSCSGKASPLGYSLDEPAQGSVTARFETPEQVFCASFGGSVSKDTSTAAGKAQFAAKLAPAPAVCQAPASCP